MQEDWEARDLETAEVVRGLLGVLYRRFRVVGVDELSWTQSRVLAAIDREGPTTSSALARQEGVTSQSMGATFAGLQARQLLSVTADPVDRRQVVVSLTDAGRTALAAARQQRVKWLAQAFHTHLTDEERLQLAVGVELLDRVVRAESTLAAVPAQVRAAR